MIVLTIDMDGVLRYIYPPDIRLRFGLLSTFALLQRIRWSLSNVSTSIVQSLPVSLFTKTRTPFDVELRSDE